MFVTLFFAVYDLRTGELTYSSGGHPPPYIVRAGGRVRAAAADRRRRARRVGADAPSARGRRQLEPGDGLLLYTDGVTEAMDLDGGMFGAERLEAALAPPGRRGPRAT